MGNLLSEKSSVGEIKARFDADVERFSDLETGQSATIDAPLAMELITGAAVATTAPITKVLDIGCGAGNNTIKLLRATDQPFHCHLNDISQLMLERAELRLKHESPSSIQLFLGDFRTLDFPLGQYDIVFAAAVFHHLREEEDWLAAFQKVYHILRPGGSVWITDLISQEIPSIQEMMEKRYADYLIELGGTGYQKDVFAYIDREDSPRPLTFQLDLLKSVGFRHVDVLHKNSCFAAFGSIK